MKKITRGLLLGLLLLLILASGSGVSALTSSSGELPEKTKATTAANLEAKNSKASEFRQTACETHVKVINLRQNNIIAHTERVVKRLTKLTDAVNKYYTEKLVPQGKVVLNYDSLLANVATKKSAVIAALDKVKADTEGLTCEKDQAKAQFTTFRTDMQALLKTFKDYRFSVLQLMQAVKKSAGADADENKEASSSAKEGSE